MKIFSTSWMIALFSFLSVCSIAAAEEDERAKWISDRWQIVEAAKAERNEDSIGKLGDIVRQLGRNLPELKPDTGELYAEARRTLLSIPGHAEYFGDRIKATADAEIAGIGTSRGVRREWDFETLTQLQSPETVKVLGELLFDERDPFKDHHSDAEWRSNCMFAEGSLYKLGLNNPPVAGPIPDYENDLHTWQLWYQQVRAGTRTFSFKGDDKVYTLAGPVTGAKEPESSSTTRSSPSVAPQAAAETPQRMRWPLIVAVVAAAAALFVVIRKAKKPAPMP